MKIDRGDANALSSNVSANSVVGSGKSTKGRSDNATHSSVASFGNVRMHCRMALCSPKRSIYRAARRCSSVVYESLCSQSRNRIMARASDTSKSGVYCSANIIRLATIKKSTLHACNSGLVHNDAPHTSLAHAAIRCECSLEGCLLCAITKQRVN